MKFAHMLLTEEEAKCLNRLVTCPKCGSKAVEIILKESKYDETVNIYVKRCLKCGYEEELEEIVWDEGG